MARTGGLREPSVSHKDVEHFGTGFRTATVVTIWAGRRLFSFNFHLCFPLFFTRTDMNDGIRAQLAWIGSGRAEVSILGEHIEIDTRANQAQQKPF